MNFEEFAQKAADGLRKHYGPEREIVRKDVVKTNDVVHHGIVVQASEQNMQASGKTAQAVPVLYLDQYYEELEKGNCGFEEILTEMKEKIDSEDRPECIDSAAGILVSWEEVKERIYPVLLSAERNKRYTEGLTAEDFLDLKIVYAIRITAPGNTETVGTVKVTGAMLESFGITEEELHRTAMNNLNNDGIGIFRMEDILFHSVRGGEDIDPVQTMDEDGLYCLCTGRGHYGAAGMLLTDMIRNAANGRNCFIIPSSIHEILLLPDSGTLTQEALDDMVRSVNASEVSEEEVLSDHAYYFDAVSGSIMMQK